MHMTASLRWLILAILFLSSANRVYCQDLTIVHGRVTDFSTGEPLPFVNIFFNTTSQGGTTDFDGYFTIKTDDYADSIIASFVGYKRAEAAIILDYDQEINFILEPEVVNLTRLSR